MRTSALIGTVLAVLTTGVVLGQDLNTTASNNSRQTPSKLETRVAVELSYLLYLPDEYASQDSWPLLLFLHGAGERGDNLNRVKIHGPPKLIAQGQSFPFIVVSPQCPREQWWTGRWFELSALLDEIAKKYKVDPNRVYVTGLSMGGFGTWAMLTNDPGRFAAAFPICGGGEPRRTRRFRDVPIWAFHGAKDQVVPVERTSAMVEALRKHGSDVKLTIYPDTDHDSWTETYNNPEVFEWMLSQRRDDRD